MGEPITKFDPNGKASILSYNVPEPTSYSGRSIIALELTGPLSDWFVPAAFAPPSRTAGVQPGVPAAAPVTADQVATSLRTGDLSMFPGIKDPVVGSAGLFSAHGAVLGSSGALDTATTSVLAQGLRDGVVSPDLLPLVGEGQGSPGISGARSAVGAAGGEQVAAAVEVTHLPQAVIGSVLSRIALGDQRVRPQITDIDVKHITEMVNQGKRLSVHRTLWGDYRHTFLPDPPRDAQGNLPQGTPQIALVESYRLSSFLGQYGAGRTLKTFSLLPGEKTTISVKTFRKSETDSKSASSVLDSFSKESADDFETTLLREQSDKQAEQKSLEWHVEAEASGSWGFASAKVSGGVKGSTASQREQFSKNVSNAVNKHAAKASAKRDVQVNTSSEVKTESGEETSIVRQLENINVGRTLNFVFRQVNQEHISLLHLIDVRIGFWNGYGESVQEVPLSGLDGLLETYVQQGKRAELRAMVLEQLSAIFDYKDELVQPPMVEERAIGTNDTYLRWRRTTSTYTDETGNAISVPGIIMNADKIVLRTDGIIVDALLGQGDALDDYSAGLQSNAVRQRTLANDRESLGQKLVNDSDSIKANIYKEIFPSSVALPGKISVSASDSGVTVSTTPPPSS
ncbi:hypothetical protein ACFY2W_26985 [Streptomyces sp. NPDC001262]|uniref:hypothetical protein n=1 Tax=unclassified Streptomyces TaxID=2593676 RepID=UPI0036B1B4D7